MRAGQPKRSTCRIETTRSSQVTDTEPPHRTPAREPNRPAQNVMVAFEPEAQCGSRDSMVAVRHGHDGRPHWDRGRRRSRRLEPRRVRHLVGFWCPEHGDVELPEGWEYLAAGDNFVTRRVKGQRGVLDAVATSRPPPSPSPQARCSCPKPDDQRCTSRSRHHCRAARRSAS